MKSTSQIKLANFWYIGGAPELQVTALAGSQLMCLQVVLHSALRALEFLGDAKPEHQHTHTEELSPSLGYLWWSKQHELFNKPLPSTYNPKQFIQLAKSSLLVLVEGCCWDFSGPTWPVLPLELTSSNLLLLVRCERVDWPTIILPLTIL